MPPFPLVQITTSNLTPPPVESYRDLVARALAEDVGSGDITTRAVVLSTSTARAELVAKSRVVVAGLDVAREVWRQLDPAIQFKAQHRDGDIVETGAVLGILDGSAAPMLVGERTALNFLQHLSGIATLTRRFVDAAGGRLAILDTRKTLPTLRALAKYAVRCGGGGSHRAGLYDAVLIKDNHVEIAGGITEAIRRVRASGWKDAIEIETENLAQVDEAIAARAEIVMLDNMDEPTMREAVRRIGGRARIEISGGVTLDRLPALAAIGADCISIGALTHSAPAADISLEISVAHGSTSVRSTAE